MLRSTGGERKWRKVTDEQADDERTTGGEDRAAEIDTTDAHPARVYDYWLGGCFL
jgi:hypothetical protein